MAKRWTVAEPEGGKPTIAVIGPRLFATTTVTAWLQKRFNEEARCAADRMHSHLERVLRLDLRREIIASARVDDQLMLGRRGKLVDVRRLHGQAQGYRQVARCTVAMRGHLALLALDPERGLRQPRGRVEKGRLVIEVGYHDAADAALVSALVGSEIELIEQHLAIQQEVFARYNAALSRNARTFIDATADYYRANHARLRLEQARIASQLAYFGEVFARSTPDEVHKVLHTLALGNMSVQQMGRRLMRR